ncbi:MAG TPA: UbiA prenyltransferase family protein [Thermoanaerobaculia bacterium]|nr:UbiA prenyltransferase family protein [Thermoanaerobaculia bacterium]
MAAMTTGPAAEANTPSGGSLAALWATARPAQWVKNLVLPLPFVFGGSLTRPRGWVLAAAGVAIFSAVASAIYFVNDVRDRERDAAHPVKRHRPLAAGHLAPTSAIAAAILLGVGGLTAAFVLSSGFGRWCALYAGLMICYSLGLKDVPFLEALIVAAGLPLRALAGAALAVVPPSPFLMGCAFLLALFLVVGKRQWELQHAGNVSSSEHRAVLASYHTERLDFLFVAIALTAVAAYAAYTVAPVTVRKFGGTGLAWTVPWVVLGLTRYVRLVYRHGGGGNPTRALLIDDPWILLIVLGWILTAGLVVYGG